MIRIDPELAEIVRLGVLAFDELRIVERDPHLTETIARDVARLRQAAPPEAVVAAVRAMYRRVGLDPTKTRPSSEALWRRVRKGQELPCINTLVDICNWCSLEWQVPYGLYDRDRLTGELELRRGRAGEEYAGIRKDVVHLEGRPALVDARGPFGNPTADSERTMITPATTRALVVVFAPRALDRSYVEGVLETTSQRIREFVGGTETTRAVL